MKVPSDVVFIWNGANASIPSGWTRDTDFDGRYIRGCSNTDTTGGGTGGNDTHTHTTQKHTHYIECRGSNNPVYIGSGNSEAADDPHTHSSFYSNNDTSYTLSSESNNPPYHTVIFCKSDGTKGIADDMLGFIDNDSIPDGWKICDGNNGTPNLINKFIKSADAGGDAGSTGGNETHTHTTTAHSHPDKNSRAAQETVSKVAMFSTGAAESRHIHKITFSSETYNIHNEKALPNYYLINIVQNKKGIESTPKDIIGLWKGNISDVPNGWERINSTDDYFIRCSDECIVGTGGVTEHNHVAYSHMHTLKDTYSGDTLPSLPSGVVVSSSKHDHSWSCGGATVVINNSSSEEMYPRYIKVFFIKNKILLDVYKIYGENEETYKISYNNEETYKINDSKEQIYSIDDKKEKTYKITKIEL